MIIRLYSIAGTKVIYCMDVEFAQTPQNRKDDGCILLMHDESIIFSKNPGTVKKCCGNIFYVHFDKEDCMVLAVRSSIIIVSVNDAGYLQSSSFTRMNQNHCHAYKEHDIVYCSQSMEWNFEAVNPYSQQCPNCSSVMIVHAGLYDHGSNDS